MKDIDFDELDRAVGSVLGSDAAAHPAPQADLPAIATMPGPSSGITTATTADDAKSPLPAVSASENGAGTAATISPAVSPARKRGQFLDMVHPSADMTKTPKMSSTSRKSLSPLTPTVVASVPQPSPVNDAVSEPRATEDTQATTQENHQFEAQTPVIAEDTTDDTNRSWPDPLDFAKESAEASAVSQEPQPHMSSSAESTTEQAAIESTQTPFVADAKVDKRPLGAFAVQDEESTGPSVAEPTQSLEEAPEFNPEVNSIEATGLPQAEDEATGLVGEVPKDETISTGEQADIPEEPAVAEPNPVVEKVEPETVASPEEPIEPIAPAAVSAPVAGAQSISQQYKTAEPATDDDGSHPLFDTEEYHQPLLPDAKKKSKKVVLIIVMLVVLLILGGALGYIAYTIGI